MNAKHLFTAALELITNDRMINLNWVGTKAKAKTSA